MAGLFQFLGESLSSVYSEFIQILPASLQKFIAFFILALLIVLYAFVVWKFYKSISKKDIITLNLKKYNKTEYSFLARVLAGVFFLIEYIIVSPLIIFLWFGILTLLLIIITSGIETSSLLILSGILMAAIRITAYYRHELSQEIAKIVPITLLATSLLNPNFFSVERVISTVSEIPTLIGDIGIYLVFIVILEVILRAFDFTFSFMKVE